MSNLSSGEASSESSSSATWSSHSFFRPSGILLSRDFVTSGFFRAPVFPSALRSYRALSTIWIKSTIFLGW